MSIPSSLSQWQFPFHLQLHLKPFINHWRSIAASPDSAIPADVVEQVEELLRQSPELLEPTKDISLFEDHHEFLDLLFSNVLPAKGFSHSAEAITAPFSPYPSVKATEAYHKIVNPTDGHFKILDLTISGAYVDLRVLYAYKLILKKFYNIDLNVDQPVLTSLVDKKSGLSRYFKLVGNVQFIEIIPLAPLPKIDNETLQDLLDRHFEPDVWARLLPPENFIFSGTSLVSLMDVTIEQAVARIQSHLLRNPDEDDSGWFQSLRQEIQSLFRLSGLRLGIATIQRDGELNFTSKNPIWNSLVLREIEGDPRNLLPGSIYEEVRTSEQTIIIEDLSKHRLHPHPLMQAILKAGYNNMICAPIHYGHHLIGILELASPITGEVNGLSLFKINQIKPIFSVAMKRLLEEFENKVEAIMLQQFTSIHPAIAWRFRDAAISLLDQKSNGVLHQNILFEDVYPFYGSLDIRDSSRKRSKAIERDLLFNLDMAMDVLRHGYEILSFDILGELIHDADKYRQKINASFSSADEVGIAVFIRKEVNPVITHLGQHYSQMQSIAKPYLDVVSRGTGISTLYRSGYEEALALVNNSIVQCLDMEEADLQRLYPCYFEKYKTDGVEYNIYAGSSIARGRELDPLYLDNLRLRQLLWTCKIVRQVHELQPQLKLMFEKIHQRTSAVSGLPDDEGCIEIAPLILAYATPITLKFRPDEKRIDVDGSYNVRYEMLKKRIDKAKVLGSQERLTQPGHLAIVYSQDQELEIYQRHLHYLLKKEMIYEGWERLDLEPLQGVEGLKSLRVKVILNGTKL
jgi:hypothetical protein